MKKTVKLSDLKKVYNPSFDDGVSINADATYTSATAVFVASDVGKVITGTNIPDGTTILSRTNATTIELTNNATAGGTALHFQIQNRERSTIDVLIADIPAKSIIDRSIILPTIALAGGALSAATGRLYVMPANTAQGAGTTNLMSLTPGTLDDTGELEDVAAPIQLVARVALTGANLSELTAGEFEVHAFYTMLR